MLKQVIDEFLFLFSGIVLWHDSKLFSIVTGTASLSVSFVGLLDEVTGFLNVGF